MREGDAANPGVPRVLHADARPGVALVLRLRGVEGRFTTEILDAGAVDPAGPEVARDGTAAEVLVDRGGQWRVERDGVAVNRGDATVPQEFPRSRLPREAVAVAAHIVHAKCLDPLGGTRAADDDAV